MTIMNILDESKRIQVSTDAKIILSFGILTAVQLFEAAYDKRAADQAVTDARNHELEFKTPRILNFMDYYRKTLHDVCLEANPTLAEILFTMLDKNWNGSIEMAEECMDDATVEGQAP